MDRGDGEGETHRELACTASQDTYGKLVVDVTGVNPPNAEPEPAEPVDGGEEPTDGAEEVLDRAARRGRVGLGGEEPAVFDDDPAVNAVDESPTGDQLTQEEVTEVSAQIAAAKAVNPAVEGN
jgi:hypothetical protein